MERMVVSQRLHLDYLKALSVSFVQACDECNGSRPLKQSHAVVKPIVATQALEIFEMDFVSFQEDVRGYKHAFTVIDQYTKKACAFRPRSPSSFFNYRFRSYEN
jgi:hypothetical protein